MWSDRSAFRVGVAWGRPTTRTPTASSICCSKEAPRSRPSRTRPSVGSSPPQHGSAGRSVTSPTGNSTSTSPAAPRPGSRTPTHPSASCSPHGSAATPMASTDRRTLSRTSRLYARVISRHRPALTRTPRPAFLWPMHPPLPPLGPSLSARSRLWRTIALTFHRPTKRQLLRRRRAHADGRAVLNEGDGERSVAVAIEGSEFAGDGRITGAWWLSRTRGEPAARRARRVFGRWRPSGT